MADLHQLLGQPTEAPEDASPSAFDQWSVVELFGHKRLAGRVRQVELFGGAFLRIDVPAGDSWSTHLYGAPAIYGVHPVSEEIARAVAARCQPEPVHRWELPARAEPAAEVVDDVDPDGDEDLDDEDEDPF